MAKLYADFSFRFSAFRRTLAAWQRNVSTVGTDLTGTVYNVRVRALRGCTGQSGWSMPGSSIVD